MPNTLGRQAQFCFLYWCSLIAQHTADLHTLKSFSNSNPPPPTPTTSRTRVSFSFTVLYSSSVNLWGYNMHVNGGLDIDLIGQVKIVYRTTFNLDAFA